MNSPGGAVITEPDYLHREVRDLAWACFAPPLLRTRQLPGVAQATGNCALELTPARLQWLAHLDADPCLLLGFLGEPPRRLGLYFEKLWHFFLQQDPATELLAHNLAVREGGRTLGEFDVIYYCREREAQVHLELAVKYFLGYADTGQPPEGTQGEALWLGPNSNDRLDLKVAHMLQRQIRLAEQPAAQEVLAELGVASPLREVEIKGYLFQPWRTPLPLPAAAVPAPVSSDWLHQDDLPAYLSRQPADSRFLILPRIQWLAPARVASAPEVLSPAEFQDNSTLHFAAGERPLLVAALNSRGREYRRFFLTSAAWPQAGRRV